MYELLKVQRSKNKQINIWVCYWESFLKIKRNMPGYTFFLATVIVLDNFKHPLIIYILMFLRCVQEYTC